MADEFVACINFVIAIGIIVGQNFQIVRELHHVVRVVASVGWIHRRSQVGIFVGFVAKTLRQVESSVAGDPNC